MRTIAEIHLPKCRLLSLLLIFSLILITNIAFGQKIEPGRYVLDYANGEYSQVYYFFNDSMFTFLERTDMEKFYGEGKYYLDDSILTLSFDSDHKNKHVKIPLCYKIIKEYSANTDTIVYSFKVLGDEDEPLEYAIISVYKDIGPTSQIKTHTNKKGKAKLKFNKSYVGNVLSFTYVGYETCVYLITDSLSREFIINLKQFQLPVIYINNKTFQRLIRFDENNNLYIRVEWNHWLHFVRAD